MTVYKIVVRAFVFVSKTGKAARLTQGRKIFITAGKKLMSIALVAYIKDNGILRAVENAVQRNGQFDNAKVRGKVAAVFANNIYYSCADFLGQLFKFFLRKFFDVFRRMNF
jgi:hypothetical protein